MIGLLLTMMLGQTTVLQNGALKGRTPTVDCQSGVTCSVANNRWILTAPVTDGGPAIVYAPLDAGYWLAHAVATLPNGKDLGALSTGLVLNTSGTPSQYAGAACGASNYASATSASGALTCSIPPGTCSGGTASGSLGSIQYNGNGVCSGLTNFLGDGTRPEVIAETSIPSVPTATDSDLVFGWLESTGMPVRPVRLSQAVALPMPEGMLAPFTLLGTNANWRVSGCVPVGFGAITNTSIGAVTSGGTLCSNGSASCTATAQAWASTNLYTRSPVTQMTKTSPAGTNIWCGLSNSNGTGNPFMWRGNAAGAGGFLWFSRVFIDTAPSDGKSVNKMFAGLINTTAPPTGTRQPSVETDTAYFGCDNGEAQTLHFCTNDNSGSATCSSLGSNFPIQSGAWYDLYIWAKPNDSHLYAAAIRLDTRFVSSVYDISSDLPRNTVQLGWNVLLGSGGGDAGATAIANGGTLTAWNY